MYDEDGISVGRLDDDPTQRFLNGMQPHTHTTSYLPLPSFDVCMGGPGEKG